MDSDDEQAMERINMRLKGKREAVKAEKRRKEAEQEQDTTSKVLNKGEKQCKENGDEHEDDQVRVLPRRGAKPVSFTLPPLNTTAASVSPSKRGCVVTTHKQQTVLEQQRLRMLKRQKTINEDDFER